VIRDGRAEFVLASGAGRAVRGSLTAALAEVNGRGGGKPGRAQGSGPRTVGLAAELAAARAVLTRG
jgi:alanyl-tRNA synthetase